ncbi:MAG TPA: adenylate/guanylate cyclase domain-containing protein [Methylomirabilota bacterium]|nr:adenylate/guanylate cyclase domain-containing protein [Methylomirabilota bacterium]
MRCSRCQAENREGLRFCEDCGARLAATCPSCGAELTPGKKFCGSCGTSLAPAQPESRYASPQNYTPKHLAEKILTSKGALEGERKQVTVLFADLKGSMELLADRDPEEARKILDPVLELMMEAVHRYEGTVNQVMGDGIMALFGAPLAHEDHAVRACYAALDMQAAMRRYTEEVRRAHGVEVQIRVGLNSGEVVVRAIRNDLRTDYTALGQTTHLAARMEQLATPGTIRLTADTLRLAEGYVEVKPLGPVPVKGLEHLIDVYEMVGAGPIRSRLHAAAVRGLTRFVGRESEFEALRQALARTAAGHGQVIAIVGEAGVGKSRLVWEVTHSHRVHGWLVLQTSSVSYGKATNYLPIVDLLKEYFGIEDRDGPRNVHEKLAGKLLTLDRALEGHLPALLSLLDVPTDDPQWSTLDPPQRRRRTLDAVKQLLLRESQVQPLLVVVEDLHWIDSETQALLDGLVESLPAARILLLVNYRPEYQHPWGSRAYYSQLRLGPLPTEGAERLLAALLGSNLEPLTRVLIAQTEGNPFFLEECVRTLVETRALTGERGAYQLTRPLPAIKVPATVQAVIAARIDRLGAVDKALLQTASVLGKDVPLGLLQAIADLGEDELYAAIARLQAAEFLYEAGTFPDIEYTFKHALTHEVAYGSLLQDRRRALHVRIVETIERLYADRLAEHVERLAHHAFLGKDWAKAITYLQQAGAKAFARSVHREAIGCFEDALTALSHLRETRETVAQAIDLRCDLRNALLPLAEWERIQGYLREAEALARTSNDLRRLGAVLGYMSGLHLNTGGRASDVRALAQQVEAIGAALGDVPLQVAGQYYHVWLGALSGDHRGTERLCRTLMDSLPGDLSRERFGLVAYPAVVSRAFLARALAELGAFDEGRDHGGEAVRLAEALDHPFSLVWACLNLGHLEGLRGEFTRATVPLERAVALSREWTLAYLTPIAMAALGHVLAGSGRVVEGVSWLQQALTAYASAGIGYLQSMSAVRLGEAYLLAGRVDEARACGTRAVMLARERGERGHEAWAHRLLGETASHHDCPDVAAAEAHLASSTALASELGMRPLVARCRLSLGKLHGQAGDRRAATGHLTTAMGMFHEMGMQFWFEKAEAEVQTLKIAGFPPSADSPDRA